MAIPDEVAFFFAPPHHQQVGLTVSTLHLNRREVQDCLFGGTVPEAQAVAQTASHRIFATVMVISAGIDLLSTMYSGPTSTGVGQRMVTFAETFMFDDSPNANTLAKVFYYGCRNPMLHSFSLHNRQFPISLANDPLLPAISEMTTGSGQALYVVGVHGLYRAYVSAIGKYHEALEAESTLRARFDAMFPTYGAIGVTSSLEGLFPRKV